MTYIGARHDFTACDQQNSSRKSVSQSAFGGAAIACLVLGSAWILTAHVFLGTGADPAAVSANVEAVTGGVERLTFSARFDALGAAPEGVSVVRKSAPAARQASDSIRKTYMALLDVTYSLGPPPGSFSATMPRGPDRHLAMLAPDPSGAQDVAPALLPQRAADSVPLPASRPSTLRLLASREVAKAKAAIMAVTSAEKPSIFEKLYGKPPSKPPLLAFASADFSDVGIPGPAKASPMGNAAPYDRETAVYDISARTVYLPDGTKLEAHSGLGTKLDDPRYVHVKMHGATPPHVYDLSPREALFHGVPALRLKPVGGEQAIFGRTGLLAHTYMLGPNGDSNGCVSFKDYYAFLNAYRNGGIKRLAVVARVE
ncbi:DUF2778 domain-containing protein [Bradyrhizobium sp.]|jgi:hypothetical protein|uniref:DUF2778 domain-containing protein n=1 Tax=Bradyrhizobium sp. TaxID=376 RepID=UPI002DFBFF20|nr:DUF2778 domain-containing protein [Bradyrhizobium sp.]